MVDDSFDDDRLMEMINKLAPLDQRPLRKKMCVPETSNTKRKLEDFEDQSMDCVKVPKLFLELSYNRSCEGEADVGFKRMRISSL